MPSYLVRKWRRQPRRDRNPNKIREDHGRKPQPPPIGTKRSVAVIPFNELPTHVQAAQAAERRRYDPND